MDFKILHTAARIIVWLLVLAVIYALYPYIGKLLHVVQSIHDFAK